MNRVVEVNASDLDVRVEPGVTRKQLNSYLHDTGLFFPIDPGADATLGGMASTRASGTNAVRYGTMRDNVLGVTVVLADGRVIKTRRARAQVGGRLRPHAPVRRRRRHARHHHRADAAPVRDSGGAVGRGVRIPYRRRGGVTSVIEAIQCGIPIARVELLDTLTVKAVNRYSKLMLRESPTLWYEFHGTTHGVEEQAKQMQEIARSHGGLDFEWATRPEERSRLWQARHDAYFACLQLRKGSRMIATDVCVPISRLADCIAATQEDIARSSMPIPLFGHVGDGNFHLMILVDPESDADIQEAWDLEHTPCAPRARHGRHLHRRARHRPRQARVPGRGIRRGRGRDARHQDRRSTPRTS